MLFGEPLWKYWITNIPAKTRIFPDTKPTNPHSEMVSIQRKEISTNRSVAHSYLTAQGRQEQFGKSLGFCSESTARFGMICLCQPIPTQSLRQESCQALWGHQARGGDLKTRATTRGCRAQLCHLWPLKAASEQGMKLAGPSPRKKSCEWYGEWKAEEMGLRPFTDS